jgi:hypothetical protein
MRWLCSPVNECIYCGDSSDSESLSDEHLFPEGAGGDHILPRASCVKCAKETTRFERSVLRDFYGQTRAHLGLYGRRRRRSRPTSCPIVSLDGETVAVVPVEQAPYIAIRLEMPPARILLGAEWDFDKTTETDFGLRMVTLPGAVNANDAMSKRYPGGLLKQVVPISDYYRILAKVGHALGVARFGVHGFKAALSEYGVEPGGEIHKGSYFIGGAFEFGQRVEEFGYAAHAHRATFLRAYEERGWIVVRTQLFSPIGAIYDVFAGWL